MRARPATRSVRVWVATFAAGSLLAAALPAAAQEDGGTVTAEVTIAEADEACVLLSVATLDFGVLDFDDTAVSDPYTVSSCSTGSQQLFAAGTDATTAGADPIVWELVDDTGPPGLDRFAVDADLAGVGTASLITAPTLIGTLGANASADAGHQLVMPPAGSTGAGQTLSFDIVWTAVLDDAAPVWSAQESGLTTERLYAVSFAGSDTGVAVGNLINGVGAALLHTTDGGDSWIVRSELTTCCTLWDVEFTDGQTAYAVGATSLSAGIVRKTVDGGASWFNPLLQAPGNPPSTLARSLLSVSFVDSDTGWVVGGSGGVPIIARSTNGGVNWVEQAAPSGTSILWDVDFVDAEQGWAVGNGRTIIATDDGGETWTTQLTGSGTLEAVEFLDPLHGWAVGVNGALRTIDGGATWTEVTVGVDPSLLDVEFLDAARGWIVGSAGTILATVDGGASWSVQDSGTDEDLYGLSVVDASRAWAAGNQGTILTYR
jgi:photosystem II stability/assembly factor-like uncharacterized protein